MARTLVAERYQAKEVNDDVSSLSRHHPSSPCHGDDARGRHRLRIGTLPGTRHRWPHLSDTRGRAVGGVGAGVAVLPGGPAGADASGRCRWRGRATGRVRVRGTDGDVCAGSGRCHGRSCSRHAGIRIRTAGHIPAGLLGAGSIAPIESRGQARCSRRRHRRVSSPVAPKLAEECAHHRLGRRRGRGRRGGHRRQEGSGDRRRDWRRGCDGVGPDHATTASITRPHVLS